MGGLYCTVHIWFALQNTEGACIHDMTFIHNYIIVLQIRRVLYMQYALSSEPRSCVYYNVILHHSRKCFNTFLHFVSGYSPPTARACTHTHWVSVLYLQNVPLWYITRSPVYSNTGYAYVWCRPTEHITRDRHSVTFDTYHFVTHVFCNRNVTFRQITGRYWTPIRDKIYGSCTSLSTLPCSTGQHRRMQYCSILRGMVCSNTWIHMFKSWG